MEQLVTEACVAFSVTANQLDSANHEQKLPKARAWIAHEAVQGCVTSVAAFARAFNRAESSLRRALKQHFGWP